MSRTDDDLAGALWERMLRPFAVDMVERAPEIGRGLFAHLSRELPESFPDAEAARLARATQEETIRDLAARIAAQVEPRPVALPPGMMARLRWGVQRGLAPATLLRALRLGHAFLLGWILTALQERAADPAELAAATRICQDYTFAYFDAATTLGEEIYARERERYARSAAAVRAGTIAELLERREVDSRAASRRMRYELDRTHVGICAWVEEPLGAHDAGRFLELAVAELAGAAGADGYLLHSLGPLLVAAWFAPAERGDAPWAEAVRLNPELMPGTSVAIGEPAPGPAGFRRTHLEAQAARRVALAECRPAGTVTRFDQVALQALTTTDTEMAETFVRRELGALARPDDTSQRLAATLRVFLEEHASVTRAARRLGLHENTIRYRVRQAEEALERSVEADTLNLRVALSLARWLAEQR